MARRLVKGRRSQSRAYSGRSARGSTGRSGVRGKRAGSSRSVRSTRSGTQNLRITVVTENPGFGRPGSLLDQTGPFMKPVEQAPPKKAQF